MTMNYSVTLTVFIKTLNAVKEKFTSKRITIAGIDRTEIFAVKITLRCYNIYICCIYILSDSEVITYEIEN